MCARLKSELLYDAVCFATTSRDPLEVPVEPDPSLDWATFSAAIDARIGYVASVRPPA